MDYSYNNDIYCERERERDREREIVTGLKI